MRSLAAFFFLCSVARVTIAADDYLVIAEGKTRPFAEYAISTAEAAQRLSGKAPPLLLDVREREEYEVSHLPSARFLSFRSFEITELADVPKDRPVILYCTVGVRSGKVAQQLSRAGYKDVHHIRGGIIQWFNEGRLVERNGKPANEVHPYNDYWKRFVAERKL